MMVSKNHKAELRHDFISDEWVLVAPTRFHPDSLKRPKVKRVIPSASQDVFRDPFQTVSEQIILHYAKGKRCDLSPKKNWDIVVLQNKYPAVAKDAMRFSKHGGPYEIISGIGQHDLLITKNPKNNFAHLSVSDAFHVFEAFRDRYLMLFEAKVIAYISIFHNWGVKAGASVYHPHYQIMGVPIIPPDIARSLLGAQTYYRKNKKCAHCAVIAWEKKQNQRIIAESRYAIAFAPFVSRNNFEVKIFPKRHSAFFENTLDAELEDISGLLRTVLRKLEKNLHDPDYNFYIHTAPMKHKERYGFYHWHIEVVPRWNTPAGFEYDTGMMINVVDPNVAAKILRK